MEAQFAKPIGLEVRLEAPTGRGPVAASQSIRDGASHLIRHVTPSAARDRIEAFIARAFKAHFDADVREFMPTLAGLYDEGGSLKAAVGYRAAASDRLFLEAYSNAPIEQVLSAQTGLDVARDAIVEVGSLACNGGRAAMEIVLALGPALIEDGFSWVVFTGADSVRNVFRRLDLRPVALCIANRAMLGEHQHEWGSYYDHNPVVMAGKLAEGVAALEPPGGAH